jgi:hypothetical protein
LCPSITIAATAAVSLVDVTARSSGDGASVVVAAVAVVVVEGGGALGAVGAVGGVDALVDEGARSLMKALRSSTVPMSST